MRAAQTKPVVDDGPVLFDDDYRKHIASREEKIEWLVREVWRLRDKLRERESELHEIAKNGEDVEGL